ncbi:type II toxin-antitoxin system RelB/DinJ family antitoxin [Candidatus Williamhamiltonella defendens]|uniref:type II toxin-antitoxin system RelB/DinJ family antitoxin n=1 Tax=Candidatus Williamhamiltonella defendens TaxID=138072 RepID=UPI001583B084|nr:type II toxin-antitoxin system RelB/DinJ family antitoxin [Candidatus Hamiltonella defensa]
MTENTLVRAKINSVIKDEAASVLADMGLTVSDVVRIVLTKVAKERALPFEMCSPNQQTVKTLKNSESGKDLYYAKDADDMFKQLGI